MGAHRLGGWWRLWLLFSVALGAIVFAATFDPKPTKLEWIETVPAGTKIDYEKWRDDRLAGRACMDDFVYPLHITPLNGRPNAPGTIHMWCNPKPDYSTPLTRALIPGALLLILGLAFSWVRAGFASGRS